jgi:hypothetical protein
MHNGTHLDMAAQTDVGIARRRRFASVIRADFVQSF